MANGFGTKLEFATESESVAISNGSVPERAEGAWDLSQRIDPANKRLLNCQRVDVNQLIPLK